MKRMYTTCGTCSGTGIVQQWIDVAEDEKTGTRTCQLRTVPCKHCNGNGHTEYAAFSIEEAEAILKHCGLDNV